MTAEQAQELHDAVVTLEARLEGSGAGQTFVSTTELALVVAAARAALPRELRFTLRARRGG
jgi:hypothetical protein